MKLSEILESSTVPQCRGKFFVFDDDGRVVEACVLGQLALYLGLGPEDTSVRRIQDKLVVKYGIDMYHTKLTHPARGMDMSAYLDEILIGLNDHYGWTLPEIASWLRERGL